MLTAPLPAGVDGHFERIMLAVDDLGFCELRA
jgi:hypothetical protein